MCELRAAYIRKQSTNMSAEELVSMAEKRYGITRNEAEEIVSFSLDSREYIR